MPPRDNQSDRNRGIWSPRKKPTTSKSTGDAVSKEPAPPKRHPTDYVYKSGKGPNSQEWQLELISGYNLKWTSLRDWLENKFDGKVLSLDEQCFSDKFEVYLSRRLEKEEWEEIDKLREPVYKEPESYESDPPRSP